MKGTVVAFITLAAVALVVPGQGQSQHVQTLLTVSTFLFAILAGFYMTRLNQRYDLVRDLLAEEDADWLTFYESTGFFEPQLRDVVRPLIDEYYIRALDSSNIMYYKQTRRIFRSVHEALQRAKPSDFPVIAYMAELLANLEKTRNKIAVVATEHVRKSQWVMLTILAGIILFCLFYLQEYSIYSYVSTVLLGTVLVMILLVMRDLMHFRLGGELIAVESGEEMFDWIGTPRYYNKSQLKDGSVRLPPGLRRYRLGTHNPGEENLRIQVITP